VVSSIMSRHANVVMLQHGLVMAKLRGIPCPPLRSLDCSVHTSDTTKVNQSIRGQGGPLKGPAAITSNREVDSDCLHALHCTREACVLPATSSMHAWACSAPLKAPLWPYFCIISTFGTFHFTSDNLLIIILLSYLSFQSHKPISMLLHAHSGARASWPPRPCNLEWLPMLQLV
jgi:hypothetical protein